MKKNTLSVLGLGALLLALLPGCSTNTQGDDASPVFLTGEFTELPLEKLLVERLAAAVPDDDAAQPPQGGGRRVEPVPRRPDRQLLRALDPQRRRQDGRARASRSAAT